MTRLSSSAAVAGQWRAPAGAPSGRALAVALAAGGAILAAAGGAKSETDARHTPSGQPVPRYVSTKFATVNARSGPGDDYKLLWTYHARALPLQVIAETEDWRRVCDPEGGVAWVHRRTVGDARTVLRASPRELPLRRRPSDEAPAAAMLSGRAIAQLKGCEGGWCRISADKASGWVRADDVWGVADAPQCRPATS